jgi:hypothetical protein
MTSKISIPLKKLSKSSIDLVEKPFDSKLSGEWAATADKEEIFANTYIQKKFKDSLYTQPFVFFKIFYDIELQKTVFLLLDSSKITILDLEQDNSDIYLKKYRETTKRFTFFPVSITELSETGDEVLYHSISALYDKKFNKVEIFDSIGSNFKDFKKSFKKLFSEIYGTGVKTVYLVDRCAAFGKLEYERCDKSLYKYKSEGFCAIWTFWFLELRLANPNVPKEKLIEKALKRLKNKDKVCELLRGYAQFVDNIVSKYSIVRTSKNLVIKPKETVFVKKDYRFLYVLLASLVGGFAAFRILDKIKKNQLF